MEYNAEKVMMGLHSCTRGRKSNDDRPCLECPYEECNIVGGTSERQTKGTCQGWLMKDALALLREKDAEIEGLKEMNDALASGFGTVKADIAKQMIDSARKQAFVAGDNQYISIAELEQIAKGEMT